MSLRLRALASLLRGKGCTDPAALDALNDTYQTTIGPRYGARSIARAGCDATFRK